MLKPQGKWLSAIPNFREFWEAPYDRRASRHQELLVEGKSSSQPNMQFNISTLITLKKEVSNTHLLLPNHGPKIRQGIRSGSLSGNKVWWMGGQVLNSAGINVIILRWKFSFLNDQVASCGIRITFVPGKSTLVWSKGITSVPRFFIG